MKILLAVDSSAASEIAGQEIASRPWPPGSAVEIVSAIDYCAWNVPELNDALVDSAREAIRAEAAQLEAAGVACSSKVLCGDPKISVIDYAAESGADLVVIGSHDASDVTRLLLGSVARAVVRHVPCSVEIVRPRTSRESMKVMIATDGSEYSEQALRSVVGRPWPEKTEFRVVSVAELPAFWFRSPAFLSPTAMADLRAEAMQRAEDAVANAEKILADAGFSESGTEAIPYASPSEIILNQAAEWGADLIVVGSHGRRGAGRFLLGGVSERIALHAACSVEIVRARK
jgi:nucleotide-binding universal stress UspA family protein